MPKQVFRLTALEAGEILGRHLIHKYAIGGPGRHTYRTVSLLPDCGVEVTVEVVEYNSPPEAPK